MKNCGRQELLKHAGRGSKFQWTSPKSQRNNYVTCLTWNGDVSIFRQQRSNQDTSKGEGGCLLLLKRRVTCTQV